MTPKVSICVQTYQHAGFIEQCLDGLLSQKTDFPFEILLGEDCSTDGTREICENYARGNPDRIRLFLHARENNISINGKPSGRYNFLNNLKNVRGKYFAICEGDDYWSDEHKLQIQHDFMESNTEYALCFHGVDILGNGGSTQSHIEPGKSDTTSITDLARKNYIYTCSCFYRNHLPESFPASLMYVPFFDYVLHLYTAQYGKIKYLDRNMAVYRVHDSGLWSSLERSEQLSSLLTALGALQEYFTSNSDVLAELGKQKAEACMELAACYEASADNKELSDSLELIGSLPPQSIVDLFSEYRGKLRQYNDLYYRNIKLEHVLGRILRHPVSGSVIRLLAAIKNDKTFGKP